MQGLYKKMTNMPLHKTTETFHVCRYKFEIISEIARENRFSAFTLVIHVRTQVILFVKNPLEVGYEELREFVKKIQ